VQFLALLQKRPWKLQLLLLRLQLLLLLSKHQLLLQSLLLLLRLQSPLQSLLLQNKFDLIAQNKTSLARGMFFV
jgi:hypothetical protein